MHRRGDPPEARQRASIDRLTHRSEPAVEAGADAAGSGARTFPKGIVESGKGVEAKAAGGGRSRAEAVVVEVAVHVVALGGGLVVGRHG